MRVSNLGNKKYNLSSHHAQAPLPGAKLKEVQQCHSSRGYLELSEVARPAHPKHQTCSCVSSPAGFRIIPWGDIGASEKVRV